MNVAFIKCGSVYRFVFVFVLCMFLPRIQSKAQNAEWMYFDHTNTNMPDNKVWFTWIEADYAGNVWWLQKISPRTVSSFNGNNYLAFPEIETNSPNCGVHFESNDQPWYIYNGVLNTFRNDSVLFCVCIECWNQQISVYFINFCIDLDDAVWLFARDDNTQTYVLCKKTVTHEWSLNLAPDSIMDITIIGMSVTSNGEAWMATDSAGLVMFDGQNWHTFSTTNSDLPSDNIFDIEHSDDGTVYVTSPAGISYYSGGNWHTNSAYAGQVGKMAKGHNNEIWVIASVQSLVRVSPAGFFDIDAQGDGLQLNSFRNIAVDANDNVWVIGQWDGAATYHQGGVLINLPEKHKVINEVLVYPNPAKEFLYIQAPLTDHIDRIRIFNTSQCVLEIIKPCNNKIDLHNFPSGVYFLELTIANTILRKTFVKQ
ncbi:MAG: T9SS type A sorting domain-containing protein [Bacteroidetes bacterium]|nr:T9SS type A sorting domain-containing protein [Bacteroidota bacterium]